MKSAGKSSEQAPRVESGEHTGPDDPNLKKGPPLKKDIADADKRARTGMTDEPIRNTPPAGAWNDTSSD